LKQDHMLYQYKTRLYICNHKNHFKKCLSIPCKVSCSSTRSNS